MVLKASDIIWIEAEDYYVLVHSKQGRHLVRATLASFEQRLDPRTFLRVHRTAIVNVDEVRTVRDDGRLLLTLSNGRRGRRQPVAAGAGRAARAAPAALTPSRSAAAALTPHRLQSAAAFPLQTP